MEKRLPKGSEMSAIGLAMIEVFLITTHGNLSSGSISAGALMASIACASTVMIYNVEPRKLLMQFPVTILQG
jgi:hypothetical protein